MEHYCKELCRLLRKREEEHKRIQDEVRTIASDDIKFVEFRDCLPSVEDAVEILLNN